MAKSRGYNKAPQLDATTAGPSAADLAAQKSQLSLQIIHAKGEVQRFKSEYQRALNARKAGQDGERDPALVKADHVKAIKTRDRLLSAQRVLKAEYKRVLAIENDARRVEAQQAKKAAEDARKQAREDAAAAKAEARKREPVPEPVIEPEVPQPAQELEVVEVDLQPVAEAAVESVDLEPAPEMEVESVDLQPVAEAEVEDIDLVPVASDEAPVEPVVAVQQSAELPFRDRSIDMLSEVPPASRSALKRAGCETLGELEDGLADGTLETRVGQLKIAGLTMPAVVTDGAADELAKYRKTQVSA